MSETALSQIKNGKYNANPQKIFDALAGYFGVKERAELTYKEVKYAPTNISKQVYNIIANCQNKGGLAVICGDADISKSKAAQKFVADNPSNSFLVTINPCLNNAKSLLETEIQREDIRKLFPILEVENMDAEFDFLLRIARTPQAIKGAINLFLNAYDNENYTYSGLVAMAQFMDMKV